MTCYAYYNTYGTGTRDESGYRQGVLHVFPHRANRNAWVGRDPAYCEPLSGAEARCILRRLVHAATGEEARFLSVHDLLEKALACPDIATWQVGGCIILYRA